MQIMNIFTLSFYAQRAHKRNEQSNKQVSDA